MEYVKEIVSGREAYPVFGNFTILRDKECMKWNYLPGNIDHASNNIMGVICLYFKGKAIAVIISMDNITNVVW